MGGQLFFIAIGLLVMGACAFAVSDKERQATGEWSSLLQWGYLLMMLGVLLLLFNFMGFTSVILLFTLFTGAIWVWHKIALRRAQRARLAQKGVTQGAKNRELSVYDAQAGHFVEYMGGFFPIILVVFLLRSFLAEPFVIPSSSMRPGLVVGDFVLVNKFAYGLRAPILNKVMVPVGVVKNGDVVVFNYPVEPSKDFIKRIIGVPGDTIEYKNKKLSVNGVPVPDNFVRNTTFMAEPDAESDLPARPVQVEEFNESLGVHNFPVYKISGSPTYDQSQVREFEGKGNCVYTQDGFSCKVPPGKYFAMGDNRDFSLDSRYWGFVDDKQIVGKATYIWMNVKALGRIGTKIP